MTNIESGSLLDRVSDSVADEVIEDFISLSCEHYYYNPCMREDRVLYSYIIDITSGLYRMGATQGARRLFAVATIAYDLLDEAARAVSRKLPEVSVESRLSFDRSMEEYSYRVRNYKKDEIWQRLEDNHARLLDAVEEAGFSRGDYFVRLGLIFTYGLLESQARSKYLSRKLDPESVYLGDCPDNPIN